MMTRVLGVLCLAWLVQSPGAPVQSAAAGQRAMTQDEALSALRSGGRSAPGAELVVVLRIQPTPDTQRVAELAAREIESRHLTERSKGLLTEFLRAGGFVVLECDRTSDVATTLHLVTLDEAGKPLVESERIEGVGSRKSAQALIDRGRELSDAVFSTPPLPMDKILARVGIKGATMADVLGFDDENGLFGMPKVTNQLATPAEMSELRSQSTESVLWALRRALTLPVFAAEATVALGQAFDELRRCGEESLAATEGRKSAESINLFDPESIHTRADIATRVRRLKALNVLLEERPPRPPELATFRAMAAISSIPVGLNGPAESNRQRYVVMTASGLLSGWTRAANGEWVLKALTLAGD